MKYLASNITYDTDGVELEIILPTTLLIEIPDDIIHDLEIEQYISDEISNLTGFCHHGFEYEKC